MLTRVSIGHKNLAAMKNIENFPMILSVIGLIADIIAIIMFYNNLLNPLEIRDEGNLTIIIIIYIVMTYSWFTFSWYISKKSFMKINEQESTNKKIITKTTIGIGFFLLPLSITLSILKNEVVFLFIHLLIWIVVYTSIRLLIPVVFPEFEKFLKKQTLFSFIFGEDLDYSGRWICKIPYKSTSAKEDFKVDDFIVVFEREHLGDGWVTNNFWYNSTNKIKGKIDYTELDTYWEKKDDIMKRK